MITTIGLVHISYRYNIKEIEKNIFSCDKASDFQYFFN